MSSRGSTDAGLCRAALPHYADLQLDRAGHLRKDEAQLDRLFACDACKLVLIHQYSGYLQHSQSGGVRYTAAIVPKAELPEDAIDADIGPVFLGVHANGDPYFAASLTDKAAEAFETSQKVPGEWVELRREGGPNLGAADAALMACAAGMTSWARKHKYSPTSGAVLKPSQGGHARAAEKERSIFPRIDPAVIMLVATGDWTLLGRQSKWSAGRFSLLAGFAEVGETLEQAVARETFEEAGVRVSLESVRYHSSQPWPFPQTLMVGFTCQAESKPALEDMKEEDMAAMEKQGLTDDEIQDACFGLPQDTNIDSDELESAHWFHKSFLRNALQGKMPAGVVFAIPGPHALANSMISQWAASDSEGSSWAGKKWPDVEIDYGRFKYILMRLRDKEDEHSKLIVRGDKTKEYHADILEAVQAEAQAVGLEVDVLGGGRIENDIENIKIFGYSMAFGCAPHGLTAAIVRRAYPMSNISTSFAGY